MLEVLGRANSANVVKVIWLLDELGLPYTRTDAGGAFGRTNTPAYRAMNPTGNIPTLIEDGFVLWESNVILRYLCGAHAPGSPMWPADLRVRAGVDRWMDWQQISMGPPGSRVFHGFVRTPPERRDMDAVGAAMTALGAQWALLDAVLAGSPYVAGPEFTLADISLGVHVHRWFSFDLPRPDLPHLRAWYGRLLERPAYVTHAAVTPVT